MAARAKGLVDGRGAARVARRIRALLAQGARALPEPRGIVFDLDDTLYPYRAFVRSGLRVIGQRIAREDAVSTC
jgi:hypothetical protein